MAEVPKLVLIGGPPGIGKTSLLACLERRLERSACLDADDVRRFHPSQLAERGGEAGVQNVIAVLRGYLEARFPLVILTWVLADPQLVERILKGLEGLYGSLLCVHLVASPAALQARCQRQPDRNRPWEYARLKLQQIEALPTPKIDTTGLEAESVADLVIARIEALERAGAGS
ncbi:MAG TPA: zeta toxin family protein [Myxococcota bacterium]|nr:zeta toxin family protein [Myxococcota bacterium]